jgi:hypothetical protein
LRATAASENHSPRCLAASPQRRPKNDRIAITITTSPTR